MNRVLDFSKSWMQSNSTKTSISKIKATIIAISLGFALASFTILGIGHNPGEVFKSIFKSAFVNDQVTQSTLTFVGLLTLSGIANAIAFKTGLFNIGVSGQMFFSGVLMIIFGYNFLTISGPAGIFILMIMGMIVGGLVAGLSGFLKAKLNVHEVVSTILLNWALFFIGKWILWKFPEMIEYGSATKQLDLAKWMHTNLTFGYLAIGIAIVAALFIALIFRFTTLGYNLRMTGLSPEGSRAAGLKIKRNIILSMMLSGFVAGILGVISFVIKDRQVSSEYITGTNLPSIGFEGIAIALLAFNNPIAIIPVSLFFGIFESGAIFGLSDLGIDRAISDLIIGLIMYFAAISVLFQRFKVTKMLYIYIKRFFDNEYSSISDKNTVKINDFKNTQKKKIQEESDEEKKSILIKKYKQELKSMKIDKKQALSKFTDKYLNDYMNLTTKYNEFYKVEKYNKYQSILSKHKINIINLKKEVKNLQSRLSGSNLSEKQKENAKNKIIQLKLEIKKNKTERAEELNSLAGGER